jgi:uncharacterized protein
MTDDLYEYLDQIFEWDIAKARRNWMRHHVLFTEAATSFFDKNVVVFADEEHSIEEQRYTVLGESARLRTLYVVRSNGENEFGLSARR